MQLSRKPGAAGSQKPRIATIPKAEHSLREEILDLADLTGRELLPWQIDAAAALTLTDRAGTPAALESGLLVARQNGKNVVMEFVELAWMVYLSGVSILHTAHDNTLALESMDRLLGVIESSAPLRRLIPRGGVRRSKTQERIALANGSVIRFKTRTPSVGRGFGVDKLVYDEAMIVRSVHESALNPLLTSSPIRQRVYLGTAPGEEHVHCQKWADLRARGVRGDESVCWIEYSAEHPDRDGFDSTQAGMANPSMGWVVDEAYLAKEWAASRSKPLEWEVERLSIGLWPRTDDEDVPPDFDLETWDELHERDNISLSDNPPCGIGMAQPLDGGNLVLASATEADDGRILVDVGYDGPGETRAAVEQTVAVVEAWDPVAVAMDDGSRCCDLVPSLVREGVEPSRTGARDMVRATAMFERLMEERRIAHRGDERLRTALEKTRKRPIGKTGGWGLDWSSPCEVAPLLAVVLAVWALTVKGAALKPPPPAPAAPMTETPAPHLPTTTTAALAGASF